MVAYYNEIDPYAAQWLRNLIAAGLIAAGDVDERSITEVKADDIRGYEQCHFFAGIGGWSYALRLAGWDDARPVWTGSCPCQPFSSAGKGKGQSDERHLWPVWHRLIAECRPAIVFGEQVSKAIAYGWLDEVKHGLESDDYAFAAAILPACSVQALHERERVFFVAHAESDHDRGNAGKFRAPDGQQERNVLPESGGAGQVSEALSDRSGAGLPLWHESGNGEAQGDGVLAGCQSIGIHTALGGMHWEAEPSVGRVADGIPARMGAIKALGNAIVPQVAAEFIKAYSECRP